jgi:hypothetical protein
MLTHRDGQAPNITLETHLSTSLFVIEVPFWRKISLRASNIIYVI